MFSDTVKARLSVKQARVLLATLDPDQALEIERDGHYVNIIVPDPDRFYYADRIATAVRGKRTGEDRIYAESQRQGAGWRYVFVRNSQPWCSTAYASKDECMQAASEAGSPESAVFYTANTYAALSCAQAKARELAL